MSSKIFRPGDGVQTSAIAWRAAGSAVATRHPQAAESGSAAIPEARLAELQQEAEARARAAYAQGLAAGETAAQQRAQQKLDPVLNSLSAITTELATLRKRVRAEAEEDAMKLAIAIARRVLNRELATDPEAILGLIKAAFGKLNARETHRLRISPSDTAVLQEHRAKLQFPPGLEITPDRALIPGSAIFETSRGDLDASVETQLAEIERGLTDVLKRRK
jgi:flagellar assembly protein FliH